jgi:hypothetical protein
MSPPITSRSEDGSGGLDPSFKASSLWGTGALSHRNPRKHHLIDDGYSILGAGRIQDRRIAKSCKLHGPLEMVRTIKRGEKYLLKETAGRTDIYV